MNSTAIYPMGYYYKHTVYDGSSVLYIRGLYSIQRYLYNIFVKNADIVYCYD